MLGAIGILAAASGWPDNSLSASGGGQATAPPRALSPQAMISKYCVGCHNDRSRTAGLALDRLSVDRVGESVETWEKVARKLRAREMPPPGSPRPDPGTFASVSAALEKALDDWAAARPSSGPIAVHRLNRTEYVNAIRDLLTVDVDGRSLLWADEPDQEGFDNVASVLSVSPALLDGYMSAARRISRLAVATEIADPVIQEFEISRLLVQDGQMGDSLPFGSQGGASIRHHFPNDGEYQIRVRLKRQLYGYILGMGEPHQIDIRLDGGLLKRVSIGGEATGRPMPESWVGDTQGDPEFEKYKHTADAGLEVRLPVKAGPHEIGVSFVRRFRQPEGVVQPPIRTSGRSLNEFYHDYPGVGHSTISGPYSATAASPSLPSRQQIFTCRPKREADEIPCARQILSTLARRACRRPLTDRDMATLLAFYEEGRAAGGFEDGIQRGLERMLVAPAFLFRIEREPAGARPGRYSG
jgi:hypothetical protein